MMVDYHHVLALFINFRSFDKVWGMYVDDNQKSIVADIIERYLRLDKRRMGMIDWAELTEKEDKDKRRFKSLF